MREISFSLRRALPIARKHFNVLTVHAAVDRRNAFYYTQCAIDILLFSCRRMNESFTFAVPLRLSIPANFCASCKITKTSKFPRNASATSSVHSSTGRKKI